MGWIDGVVIGVIVITAIIGLAKGLFESILSILGSVLSIFLAIWASKPVAEFLNKVVKINDLIIDLLVKWGVIPNNQAVINVLSGQFTAEKAAEYLALILAGIVIWLLVKVVVFLLAKLFNSATANSSAISGLNRLLGLVFGFVKGLVYIGAVFVVLSLVGQVAFGQQIEAEMQKNTISGKMYGYVVEFVEDEDNGLQSWISKFTTKNDEDDSEQVEEGTPTSPGDSGVGEEE